NRRRVFERSTGDNLIWDRRSYDKRPLRGKRPRADPRKQRAGGRNGFGPIFINQNSKSDRRCRCEKKQAEQTKAKTPKILSKQFCLRFLASNKFSHQLLVHILLPTTCHEIEAPAAALGDAFGPL